MLLNSLDWQCVEPFRSSLEFGLYVQWLGTGLIGEIFVNETHLWSTLAKQTKLLS